MKIMLLLFVVYPTVWTVKQRPWLGPKEFYGNPPSPRQLHGFAATSKLYVFGGQSESGMSWWFDWAVLHQIFT